MHYVERIQKAIDCIEENLGDEPTLAEIAAEAGFSMFHFSRLFHLVVGETVTAYIRERRLARAADALLSTDARIIDIATQWGFASQATFSRAFKNTYGVTPGVYRRNRTPLFVEKPRLTRKKIEHLRTGFDTDPRIEELPGFTVVGMRFLWRVCEGYNVPEWWTRFLPRIDEIPEGDTSSLVGLCEYASPESFTVDRRLKYLAGVPVSGRVSIPEGMVAKEIPAATYAIFTHRANLDSLLDSCRFIFGTWLPRSGYQPAPADNFEIYSPDCFEPGAEEGTLEIHIPIL